MRVDEPAGEPLLTPAQVAELLGVSPSGLRRLAVIYVKAGGALPRDERSRSRLWPRSSAAQLAAARKLVMNGSATSVEEALAHVWRALDDGKVTPEELEAGVFTGPEPHSSREGDRGSGPARSETTPFGWSVPKAESAAGVSGRATAEGTSGTEDGNGRLRPLLLDMASLLVDVREELVRLRIALSKTDTESTSASPRHKSDENELGRLRTEVSALRRELLDFARQGARPRDRVDAGLANAERVELDALRRRLRYLEAELELRET